MSGRRANVLWLRAGLMDELARELYDRTAVSGHVGVDLQLVVRIVEGLAGERLPEDARPVLTWWDYCRNSLGVIVESEAFPATRDGYELPALFGDEIVECREIGGRTLQLPLWAWDLVGGAK